MSMERKDELLDKMKADTLTLSDCLELDAIAAEGYKKAWEHADTNTLRIVAWMLCRAILASQIAVKRK